MEQVGDIKDDDIKVMMDTNVTGLINVPSPLSLYSSCFIFLT